MTTRTRKPRKGLAIKAHKGGRTVRLPGGSVTEEEYERIAARWKASGLSWADYIVRLHQD
jgi:hypothetical protein